MKTNREEVKEEQDKWQTVQTEVGRKKTNNLNYMNELCNY